MDILALRRGRAPNCSSGGSVIGLALISATAASSILSFWSHRLLHWKSFKDRDEDFGRIIQSEDPPARIFINEQGHHNQAPRQALRAPTEVHIALTNRCPVSCKGCYLNASPEGQDASWEQLLSDVDALAEQGVFELALGGGEALLHPRIVNLAEYIRSKGMIPNLTCSGFGLNRHESSDLAHIFGQINISIDGLSEHYKATRGWNGFKIGIEAVKRLSAAGATVGVNTVLTRSLLNDKEGFVAFGRSIRDAGAKSWQWLRYKPQGRAQHNYKEKRLSSEQIKTLFPLTLRFEEELGLEIRWDCAMFPFLSEHRLEPQRLQQLGVVGCIGSERLWARDINGAFAPCSFVSADDSDMTLKEQWRHNPTLQSWRAQVEHAPQPCSSCPYRSLCRSGCKVVSKFLTGNPLAPDPECPRVSS